MKALQTLAQNAEFFSGAYNINGLIGILITLLLIDTALKGWALWRAARMGKRSWFVALLVINSVGIFPTLFLLSTNATYKQYIQNKA